MIRQSALALTAAALLQAQSASAKVPVYYPIEDIDVANYSIKLWAQEFAKKAMPVELTTNLTTVGDLDSIYLHAEEKGIDLREITVNGQSAAFEFVDDFLPVENHGLGGKVLKIDLGKAAAKGTDLTLSFRYLIKPDQYDTELGMMFNPDFHGSKVFITRNWPYYARYWLPSNDHPADNATFDFELHVPQGSYGLANGGLTEGNYALGSGNDAAGLKVYKWRQATPIPTYGINISIGEFEINEDLICFVYGNEPHNTQVPCDQADVRVPSTAFVPAGHPQKDELLAKISTARSSLVYFSTLLGPYEYAKLDFVVAPHPFSMESNSLIVLTQPSAAVHEVSHHWWGNNVLIDHWGEFWISEGFTTYFGDFVYFEMFENKDDASWMTDSGKVLSHDNAADPITLYDEDPDWTPYVTGAAALHDLRLKMEQAANPGADAAVRALATKSYLEFMRSLYSEYKFKRLGKDSLTAFAKKHLFAHYKANQLPVDFNETVQIVQTWHDFWLDR